MNERQIKAVPTRSVMEVAVLDGGERLAIAFLGSNSRPVNVEIPIAAALDLASKIMQADIDAARSRLSRREPGEMALLVEAGKSPAGSAATAGT